MGFKRSNMRVAIEDFMQNNPDYRKYFYCEHCEGKMKFVLIDDKRVYNAQSVKVALKSRIKQSID